MAVDDFGDEVLKKAGEEVVTGSLADQFLKIGGLPSGAAGTLPPIRTTVQDPVTGTQANVITEAGENKLLVKAGVSPEPLGELIFEKALTSGGSPDMNVNGSGADVDFFISADATRRKNVEELTFKIFDNGIKNANFLALNSALADGDGVLVTIRSQDKESSFLEILDTVDFDAHFSLGAGGRFNTIFAAGQDSVVAKFSPASPFILEPEGTFGTDDFVRVRIRANLSSVTFMDLSSFAFFE